MKLCCTLTEVAVSVVLVLVRLVARLVDHDGLTSC